MARAAVAAGGGRAIRHRQGRSSGGERTGGSGSLQTAACMRPLGIDRPRWPPARPAGAVVSSTARHWWRWQTDRWSGRSVGRTDGGLCASAAAGGLLPPPTPHRSRALQRPSVHPSADWIVGWAVDVECRPTSGVTAGPSRLDSTVSRRRLRAAGRHQARFDGRPRRGTRTRICQKP